MEAQSNSPQAAEQTKKCPHCQKEISKLAKRCPYCMSELRSWPARHPLLTILGGIVVILFWVGVFSNTTPNASGSNPNAPKDPGNMVNAQAPTSHENSPTLKELGTVPANYIGQSFTLYVIAKATRYYNYGFSDENAYYSFELTDDSVDEFNAVYGYMAKTPQDGELFNRALNDGVPIKIQASIPASKWEAGSNAFLEIDSWSYQ